MPSTSPGRGGRVVAETLSSSSGMRSRSVRISVPLPTPDGPVMTKTRATASAAGRAALPAQLADELAALALRQAADRLARRDAALLEDLVDLHAPVLRDREKHVEDLRRLDVLRRVQQERLNRYPAGFQVLLELRPTGPDLVRSLERIHPLEQGTFGRRRVLRRGVGGRRHRAASLHTRTRQARRDRRIRLDLDLSLRSIQAA